MKTIVILPGSFNRNPGGLFQRHHRGSIYVRDLVLDLAVDNVDEALDALACGVLRQFIFSTLTRELLPSLRVMG